VPFVAYFVYVKIMHICKHSYTTAYISK